MSTIFDCHPHLKIGALSIGLSICASAGAQVLEETLVTAQKREQALTDVPLSIHALSGDYVNNFNIFDISGIAERVPNVTFSESPFQPIIAIRGLGSSGANRGFESQVALFLDGIYGGRPLQFANPMFDVSRVEVIRGPQTVLFGKNATGGVISVHSARPTEQLTGYISSGYETEFQSYFAEGVLSGPISEQLSGRLAVRTNRQGGFLKNTTWNSDDPEVDSLMARGSLVWQATDNLEIYAKLDYSEQETTGSRQQLVCTAPGVTSVDAGPLGSAECVNDDRYSSGAISGPFAQVGHEQRESTLDTLNGVINLDWTLGEHNLTLLGGYSEYDNLAMNDVSPDFSQLGLVTGNTGNGEYKQTTLEVRIASPLGQRFEYILGAFYLDSEEHLEQDLGVALPPTLLPPIGGVLRKIWDIDQEVEAWSTFGSLTWNINERLSATGQLRYSNEDKTYVSDVYQVLSIGLGQDTDAVLSNIYSSRDTLPQLARYDLKRREDGVDYTANLKWQVNDEVMAYISYGKGSKAGGFTFFPIQLQPFPEPEDGLSYEDEEGRSLEIGGKATLMEGRAQFNLALFYTEYDDMQQVNFDASRGGFDIANAKKVISQGVELDGQVLVSEQLSLGGGVGYLDATFDEFNGVDCPDFPSTGNCDPALGQDLSGDPLPYAPQWTANLYADYVLPLGNNYDIKLHLDGNYTDWTLFQVDQDPLDSQDDYWIWNARLGFAPKDERWEVSVLVKNFTDEDDILLFTSDSTVSLVAPTAGTRLYRHKPGREIYLQARVNF